MYYIMEQLPICLPDVDGFRVSNIVLCCLVIQQIKEIFHSQRNWLTGAKNHGEQVVYKFLQCALQHRDSHVSVRMGCYIAKLSYFQTLL